MFKISLDAPINSNREKNYSRCFRKQAKSEKIVQIQAIIFIIEI